MELPFLFYESVTLILQNIMFNIRGKLDTVVAPLSGLELLELWCLT